MYCSFVEEEVYLHKGNKRDGHTEVEVSVGKKRLKGIAPCGTQPSFCGRDSVGQVRIGWRVWMTYTDGDLESLLEKVCPESVSGIRLWSKEVMIFAKMNRFRFEKSMNVR